MHYFLGMDVWTKEVGSRDPEEVWDDGLYDHTYGIEAEAIECSFIRYGRCYDVSSYDWVLDVPDEYKTRYLLCCEHIEPDPRHVHLITAKHILRYLKGTADYGLKYEANQKINLEGYVDSYWAGGSIDRKITSGCCFSMRSERSSEALVCDPDWDLSKEGVLA